MIISFLQLEQDISQCRYCEKDLPLQPKPVLQIHPDARLLIIGQAPGIAAHNSGIPFQDASGDRLRQWLGLDKEAFYNKQKVAILPMSFCFPGKAGSGDKPPLKACEQQWHQQVLNLLDNVQLTILLGHYAQAHYSKESASTVTDMVRASLSCHEAVVSLPHPSPRNNIWLKKNTWFEQDLVPVLQKRISKVLLQ